MWSSIDWNLVITGIITFITGGGLLKLLQTLRSGKPSEIQRLSERMTAVESEYQKWMDKAFAWHQKYHVLKMRTYQVMVEHNIDPDTIERLLNMNEAEELMP